MCEHARAPDDSSPEPEGQAPDFFSAAFDQALRPDPQAVQTVKAMAEELAAGQKPEFLFTCGFPGRITTFQVTPKAKPVALLFTNPFAAMDYLEVTKTAAQVMQLKFEKMPELIQKWQAAGLGGITINRCSRCPIFASAPVEAVVHRENFMLFWAVRRAAQLYFGQRTVHQFLAAKETAARKAALVLIRDHIDAGVPYVYEPRLPRAR